MLHRPRTSVVFSHRFAVIAIVSAHVLVSLLYSLVTPPWEAHDEWPHYRYAEFVAQERRLPPPGQRLTYAYRFDEATQPPLYYVLTALPLMFVPLDARQPVVNPFAESAEGINFAVHDPEVEAFPWQGRILGLYIARFATIFLTTLGLWPTYALARWLFPTTRVVALGAILIQGLMPQAAFIGSVVTNDGLVTALSGVVLLFGVKTALETWRLRNVSLLAFATALAILTKYTALPLIFFTLACLLISAARTARQRTSRRVAFLGSLAALLGMTALVGWWAARSQATTGYWATRDQETLWWLRQEFWQSPLRLVTEPAWNLLPRALDYGFQTYWASFGWGNVGAPAWVYTVFAVFCLLGAMGCVVFAVRKTGGATRQHRAALVLLLIFASFVIALPLYRELLAERFLLRGRYILPSLPAVSLLLAIGWFSFLRARISRLALVLLAAIFIALNSYLIFGVIQPAYARPAAVDVSNLPSYAAPVQARFMKVDGTPLAEVVAFDTWPDAVHAGEGLAVTLWWHVLGQTQRNLTLGVQLLDPDGNVLAQRHRFPGNGNFATSLWRPGDTFQEVVWLTLPEAMKTPARGTVKLTLFDVGGVLLAQNAQGVQLGDAVQVGRVPLRSAVTPPKNDAFLPALATFGQQVSLLQFSPVLDSAVFTRTLDVQMTWQARTSVQKPFAAFVHFLDAAGKQVWGFDRVPGDPRYPLDLWAPGEIVTDTWRLTLPADLPGGAYTLAVGLYDPLDFTRLPVETDKNTADNRVFITSVQLPNAR